MVKLFKLSDTIRIRDYSNSDQYHDVLVSSIVDYVYSQYGCKSFYTRAPSSDAGVEVRAFNDNETVYLGDKSYLGITSSDIVESLGSNDGVINTSPSSYRIYYTGSSFARERDILTYPNKVVNNIRYYHTPICNSLGSSLLSYCGVYLPPTTINIYINNILQLPFVNATEVIYKIGTPSGLIDISKYNDDYPVSSVAYNDWQSYVVPGNYIPIDSWTPQTITLKYGRIDFGSDGYGYINIRDNDGNIIAEQHGILTWLAGNKIYIIAGICEEEQRGRIGVFIEPPSGTATGVGWNSRSVDRKAYEFITQNKLGATVKVNYVVPEGDYQYCKLTYKKDTQPESVNDGTIVNLDYTESECIIEDLEEKSKYWFVIYTDKNESEAFPFLVPEIIDYGNMIFNDNSEIIAARSSYTASTTPKYLVDMYKEKSTQSGYSYMNSSANTWLIGPANNANGYNAIFGWTLPTDKDIYIVCQNDTGQNAYYVWIWWDGFTSRDMLGTNCGYYKEINVQSNGTISAYQSSIAINCYSGFSNNLTIDSNRYWSQTWLGGSESLKPIVWTELNTSRIWVNGQKLT